MTDKKKFSRSHNAMIRVYHDAGQRDRDARTQGRFHSLRALTPGSVAPSDELDAYGTVILRISPNPAGGGPKPTLET